MNIFEGPSAVEKIKAILSKRKTLFSFESCQKRVLYPEAIPHHRLGITLTPINTNGLAGPTTYNIQTTITHDLNKKPISSRGYTLGARTGPRLNTHHLNSGFPDPGAYQNFVNQSSIVKQNKKPFNQCAPRTDKLVLGSSTVGVGAYDITSKPGRRVQWQRDTMLRPVNLPSVEQKSTIPVNTDKLSTSTQSKRYQRKLAYLKLYFE
ncbi:unnamed protein product [Heterobilharzia americana]|nr:unnamed protein product [Heterobilharzia americana]